jgi:hypothetical protein
MATKAGASPIKPVLCGGVAAGTLAKRHQELVV